MAGQIWDANILKDKAYNFYKGQTPEQEAMYNVWIWLSEIKKRYSDPKYIDFKFITDYMSDNL